MARKSRESIQRRLREQRRAEKAARKRQKREERRQAIRDDVEEDAVPGDSSGNPEHDEPTSSGTQLDAE